MTRTAWIVGGVLLVGLVALGVAIRIANSRPRFHPDEGLLDELASVELIEGAPPPAIVWPGWRGPAHDGSVSFPALNRKWDARGPRVLHKLPGGDGYSSFAIRGGRAWTVVARDDEEVVVCYD